MTLVCITKFCGACGRDTIHNPPAPAKEKGQMTRDPRCTVCARPYRTQGVIHPKNQVHRRWDGKVMFGSTQ